MQAHDSARWLLARSLSMAIRLAFASLLISSPLAIRQTIAQRPLGNIFPSYTDLTLYVSDVFLLLTIGFWLSSFVISPRRFKSGPRFLTVPILALVALSWIGAITGIDPALTIYHSVRFSLLLGLYFYFVNEEPSPTWVCIPLAIGVVVQALVSVAQFVAQRSVGLSSIGELTMNPNSPGASILRLGETRVLRAYGLTEHPNILGGFFAFGLILILGWIMFRRHTRRGKSILLLVLALGGVGLVLTFSRAAAVAFLGAAGLMGLAAVWLEHDRKQRVTDLIIAALVMLGAAAMPILANRQLVAVRVDEGNSFAENSNEQRSLAERDALTASAIRVLAGHEITGVGNGALPIAMYKLDVQFPKQYDYQPAHFILLDAAAELGLPGAIVWLWLLIAPFTALLIRRPMLSANPWLVTAAAVILMFGIIGLFDYYPWLNVPGRIWQWSAWGLFGALYQAKGETRDMV